jgi:hypothetical protein
MVRFVVLTKRTRQAWRDSEEEVEKSSHANGSESTP